jgi:hypothetical protein
MPLFPGARPCTGRSFEAEDHAGVAQLVEQRIRNAKVGSSTLLTGTRIDPGLAGDAPPTLPDSDTSRKHRLTAPRTRIV